MVTRIDPPNCLCDDCQAGRSKPMEDVSREDIQAFLLGEIPTNASGGFFTSHWRWDNEKKEWVVEYHWQRLGLAGWMPY